MVKLSNEETAALSNPDPPAMGLAMRVVVESARLLGAERLIPVTRAHIDGCLYHGDAGVHFVERLCDLGGRVSVPASLNVGALDLLHPNLVRAESHRREMAMRLMRAHLRLGCQPTWTCAPYQAGIRPSLGEHVAWAESNAVVFANSVLGARTNRNGDFLDICAAISARVPYCGLHLDRNRRGTVRVDLTALSPGLRRLDAFYAVLGAWLGSALGGEIPVIEGLPADAGEDQLKALGAGAAATGAIALFHAVGITPEAPSVEAACGGELPRTTITVTGGMVRAARDALSTTTEEAVDCVALGSPHFSWEECLAVCERVAGQRLLLPVYICTRRDVHERLRRAGQLETMEAAGVTFVVDTCVVVTPILERVTGVLMTNSAKFAYYAPPNTGYEAVFGSLDDCVASALAGRLRRDEGQWA